MTRHRRVLQGDGTAWRSGMAVGRFGEPPGLEREGRSFPHGGEEDMTRHRHVLQEMGPHGGRVWL
jgi:hypothetical protein